MDGLTIAVHVWTPARPAPGAPPLLALHGFGTSGRAWRHVAQGLTDAGLTLYAPDLLGFGESDRPRRAYSLAGYADEAAAIADALGLDRPVLMGHSLGGRIALTAAVRHPARWSALVLAAPGGFALWERLYPAVAGAPWARRAMRWPWFRERVVRRSPLGPVFPDAEAFAQYDRFARSHRALDLRRTGVLARLDAIDLPTLLLWGTRDRILPGSVASRAHRHLPHARLVWLYGAGHGSMKDTPDAFADAVAAFVLRR